MRWNPLILAGLIVAPALGTNTAMADFSGPRPRIIGNDTGGIIAYAPDLEGVYSQVAKDYCASWGRLSHVTSVHRRYGDYISFVCIDKPWMIH
jgi:hypothetical protein